VNLTALHPVEGRNPLRLAKLLNLKDRDLAERVGFGLLLVVENKELTGFRLPPDPLETPKGQGRRTYCARGAIYVTYTAPQPLATPRCQAGR